MLNQNAYALFGATVFGKKLMLSLHVSTFTCPNALFSVDKISNDINMCEISQIRCPHGMWGESSTLPIKNRALLNPYKNVKLSQYITRAA